MTRISFASSTDFQGLGSTEDCIPKLNSERLPKANESNTLRRHRPDFQYTSYREYQATEAILGGSPTLTENSVPQPEHQNVVALHPRHQERRLSRPSSVIHDISLTTPSGSGCLSTQCEARLTQEGSQEVPDLCPTFEGLRKQHIPHIRSRTHLCSGARRSLERGTSTAIELSGAM